MRASTERGRLYVKGLVAWGGGGAGGGRRAARGGGVGHDKEGCVTLLISLLSSCVALLAASALILVAHPLILVASHTGPHDPRLSRLLEAQF